MKPVHALLLELDRVRDCPQMIPTKEDIKVRRTWKDPST
jgi:hypothetical protein